uniref:Uncharacterized protein n=1 Tax=Prevotella sp. GTC17262 TaxID=3236797 RepID=A0AB33JP33_9BACT
MLYPYAFPTSCIPAENAEDSTAEHIDGAGGEHKEHPHDDRDAHARRDAPAQATELPLRIFPHDS